jgi:hypothetical protein
MCAPKSRQKPDETKAEWGEQLAKFARATNSK